jgi:hypothetical protein
MATAQLLKITHGVDEKVKDVSDTVKLVLDGAWCASYWFFLQHLFRQTGKQHERSCNRQHQKQRQLCNF